jgi:hypothetical protein
MLVVDVMVKKPFSRQIVNLDSEVVQLLVGGMSFDPELARIGARHGTIKIRELGQRDAKSRLLV